jgi:hypothetical protein
MAGGEGPRLMAIILWIIAVILIVLWVLVKFVVHIEVHLIDFALVLSAVIIVYNLVKSRKDR